MTVKTSQFEALGNEIFKKYLIDLTTEITTKHPNWMNEKTNNEKIEQVQTMVEYGQRINLTESYSLTKLVNYLVQFKQTLPLSHEIVSELKYSTLDEEERIEKLYIKLASKRDHLLLIEIN